MWVYLCTGELKYSQHGEQCCIAEVFLMLTSFTVSKMFEFHPPPPQHQGFVF